MGTWYGEVESTEWLTPSLIRIALGGEGLSGFTVPAASDAYVNIAIPAPDAPYGPIFDPSVVRDLYPRSTWPARRRYTVRHWDPVSRRLSLDFVVHGDSGAGGPWAASARAGDVLVFEGPGSGYHPDQLADWHLMIGDESALPAIAASLERLAAQSLAIVRLVCDSAAHEIELTSRGTLDVAWLHRSGNGGDGDLLPDAVRAIPFPRGRVHAFVHGEADEIREIRRHLLLDRGLARSDMSCSPYWRRSMTDEAWREVKKDYVRTMEAEVC